MREKLSVLNEDTKQFEKLQHWVNALHNWVNALHTQVQINEKKLEKLEEAVGYLAIELGRMDNHTLIHLNKFNQILKGE